MRINKTVVKPGPCAGLLLLMGKKWVHNIMWVKNLSLLDISLCERRTPNRNGCKIFLLTVT